MSRLNRRGLDLGNDFATAFNSLISDLLGDYEPVNPHRLRPLRGRTVSVPKKDRTPIVEKIRNPFSSNEKLNRTDIENKFITLEEARALTQKKRDVIAKAEKKKEENEKAINDVLSIVADIIKDEAENETLGYIKLDLTKLPEFQSLDSAMKVETLNILLNILRTKGLQARIPSKDKEIVVIKWLD